MDDATPLSFSSSTSASVSANAVMSNSQVVKTTSSLLMKQDTTTFEKLPSGPEHAGAGASPLAASSRDHCVQCIFIQETDALGRVAGQQPSQQQQQQSLRHRNAAGTQYEKDRDNKSATDSPPTTTTTGAGSSATAVAAAKRSVLRSRTMSHLAALMSKALGSVQADPRQSTLFYLPPGNLIVRSTVPIDGYVAETPNDHQAAINTLFDQKIKAKVENMFVCGRDVVIVSAGHRGTKRRAMLHGGTLVQDRITRQRQVSVDGGSTNTANNATSVGGGAAGIAAAAKVLMDVPGETLAPPSTWGTFLQSVQALLLAAEQRSVYVPVIQPVTGITTQKKIEGYRVTIRALKLQLESIVESLVPPAGVKASAACTAAAIRQKYARLLAAANGSLLEMSECEDTHSFEVPDAIELDIKDMRDTVHIVNCLEAAYAVSREQAALATRGTQPYHMVITVTCTGFIDDPPPPELLGKTSPSSVASSHKASQMLLRTPTTIRSAEAGAGTVHPSSDKIHVRASEIQYPTRRLLFVELGDLDPPMARGVVGAAAEAFVNAGARHKQARSGSPVPAQAPARASRWLASEDDQRASSPTSGSASLHPFKTSGSDVTSDDPLLASDAVVFQQELRHFLSVLRALREMEEARWDIESTTPSLRSPQQSARNMSRMTSPRGGTGAPILASQKLIEAYRDRQLQQQSSASDYMLSSSAIERGQGGGGTDQQEHAAAPGGSGGARTVILPPPIASDPSSVTMSPAGAVPTEQTGSRNQTVLPAPNSSAPNASFGDYFAFPSSPTVGSEHLLDKLRSLQLVEFRHLLRDSNLTRLVFSVIDPFNVDVVLAAHNIFSTTASMMEVVSAVCNEPVRTALEGPNGEGRYDIDDELRDRIFSYQHECEGQRDERTQLRHKLKTIRKDIRTINETHDRLEQKMNSVTRLVSSTRDPVAERLARRKNKKMEQAQQRADALARVMETPQERELRELRLQRDQLLAEEARIDHERLIAQQNHESAVGMLRTEIAKYTALNVKKDEERVTLQVDITYEKNEFQKTKTATAAHLQREAEELLIKFKEEQQSKVVNAAKEERRQRRQQKRLATAAVQAALASGRSAPSILLADDSESDDANDDTTHATPQLAEKHLPTGGGSKSSKTAEGGIMKHSTCAEWMAEEAACEGFIDRLRERQGHTDARAQANLRHMTRSTDDAHREAAEHLQHLRQLFQFIASLESLQSTEAEKFFSDCGPRSSVHHDRLLRKNIVPASSLESPQQGPSPATTGRQGDASSRLTSLPPRQTGGTITSKKVTPSKIEEEVMAITAFELDRCRSWCAYIEEEYLPAISGQPLSARRRKRGEPKSPLKNVLTPPAAAPSTSDVVPSDGDGEVKKAVAVSTPKKTLAETIEPFEDFVSRYNVALITDARQGGNSNTPPDLKHLNFSRSPKKKNVPASTNLSKTTPLAAATTTTATHSPIPVVGRGTDLNAGADKSNPTEQRSREVSLFCGDGLDGGSSGINNSPQTFVEPREQRQSRLLDQLHGEMAYKAVRTSVVLQSKRRSLARSLEAKADSVL